MYYPIQRVPIMYILDINGYCCNNRIIMNHFQGQGGDARETDYAEEYT